MEPPTDSSQTNRHMVGENCKELNGFPQQCIGTHRAAILEAFLHLLALAIDPAEELLVVLVTLELSPHILLKVAP